MDDTALRAHLDTPEGLAHFRELMLFRRSVKALVRDETWSGCRDAAILDALKLRLQCDFECFDCGEPVATGNCCKLVEQVDKVEKLLRDSNDIEEALQPTTRAQLQRILDDWRQR